MNRNMDKLCRFCGQPMKPKGVKKQPNYYDHAQGCPYARTGGQMRGIKYDAANKANEKPQSGRE